jgi:DNA-binding NarL/FixJ family response regulator
MGWYETPREIRRIRMPVTRARLLLADDHRELLRDIQQLLASDFDVVGRASDGLALVGMAQALKPDVVVTDLRMPKLNGIEAGRRILQQQLCKAVILLTEHHDPYLVRRALDAGIRGYVPKATASEELLPAIYRVLEGRVFISASIRFTGS